MTPKRAEAELLQRLEAAKAQISIGGVYKHYKNGALYKVLDIAILTECDDQPGVIYQAQYGQRLTFIRPAAMWVEDVEFGGKIVKRFAKLSESESKQQ